MLKTYLAGVVLGIAAIFAGLHYVPVVDLARETSLVSVTPNGGNAEAFHANLPGDRIMLGGPGESELLPPDLQWPAAPAPGELRTELFKLRNARNAVIGVASRFTEGDAAGAASEWVLHLPARGTMYVLVGPGAGAEGRRGVLRAGTREFEHMSGAFTERRLRPEGDDPELSEGRLELVATYVAAATPEPSP